jgi:F420-dependent oxidoreductase-like protein
VRISLNVTNHAWDGDARQELVRIAGAADEAGLDTVWVADHLLQVDPSSSPEEGILEAYTLLGFLAARTERVRIGAMVTPVTYRPPAVLIKAVTTLDVLSGGRAWLGLGSGYSQEEADAMGLPLPPAGERFDRLEEVLELARRMWSGDDSAFEGEHYRLDRPVGSPRPLTEPHPPVLVGGMGERRTLRLVARHADACNLFDIPDEGRTVRRKLDVLAAHCADAGRDPGSIEKTISTRLHPGEPAAGFAARCRALGELGIDHVVAITPEPWSAEAVGTLGAAARELA